MRRNKPTPRLDRFNHWIDHPGRVASTIGALLFFLVACVIPVLGTAWFLFACFMAVLEWLGLIG